MSDEFPVVAFLQNCWFPKDTPQTIIRAYLTDQSYRRKVLAKSMTGRRLIKSFGSNNYQRIWWDNASEHVASTAPGRVPADVSHVTRVLLQVKPSAILCFGKIAMDGLELAMAEWQRNTGNKMLPDGVKHHYFPHPNARGLRQSQLDDFARQIISRYL